MTHAPALRRRRWRWIAVTTLAAAAAVLCGALASTASAAIPNLERVTVYGRSNSSNSKSVTATCPPFKYLYGTGAGVQVAGMNGLFLSQLPQGREVHISGVLASQNSVTVSADEDMDGATRDWRVRATAICANWVPPTRVTIQSSTSSSHSRVATAYCPAGEHVLGAGGRVDGFAENAQVMLDEIRPMAWLDGVTVSASEDQYGTGADWSVQAQAICASPPPGLERVAADGPFSYSSYDELVAGGKHVTATCPSGKHLIGSGGKINPLNPYYPQYWGQVALIGIGPSDSTTDGATATAFEDQDGALDSWSASSYAICA